MNAYRNSLGIPNNIYETEIQIPILITHARTYAIRKYNQSCVSLTFHKPLDTSNTRLFQNRLYPVVLKMGFHLLSIRSNQTEPLVASISKSEG